MILTSNPSITKLEEKYVLDALRTANGEGAYKYVEKFQEAFKKYTGFKYAIATSGATGALTLAYACVLERGDEIITQDLGYFGPLDVLVQMGVKPVFVDIDETWCLDPLMIEKAITSQTKAIMPVYSYGAHPKIHSIREIAKAHDLYVIDDCAPAMGSFVRDHHAGFYSDMAAFSFQGAKIITTGLGGMFATNNEEFYKKALYLNSRCQVSKFFQDGHGYNFALSDLACAQGLAQLERIEEIIEKKRKIHKWYEQYLDSEIRINRELPDERANMWFTSILAPMRDEFIKELKERGIDSRPFFYPPSKFPMYKEADTPNAHTLACSGINLPSSYELTEKDVKYISNSVNEIYESF